MDRDAQSEADRNSPRSNFEFFLHRAHVDKGYAANIFTVNRDGIFRSSEQEEFTADPIVKDSGPGRYPLVIESANRAETAAVITFKNRGVTDDVGDIGAGREDAFTVENVSPSGFITSETG